MILNPTSAVENCKQSYVTGDGIVTCMSSRQYHRSFKACAAGLLLKYKVEEIDLISLFYNNMEASVKEIVVKKYPKHGQIHSRLASDIENELLELL